MDEFKQTQDESQSGTVGVTPLSLTVAEGRGTDCEILLDVLKQTAIPFLVAGIGQSCTGLFFDRAQKWPYFVSIPETFVMVPSLLGLKGNIEMTYASRVTTMSNKGEMRTKKEILMVMRGNLCVIEVQAITLTLFVSIVCNTISTINCNFVFWHAAIATGSAMFASTLSSLLVGLLMIALVLVVRRYDINPDNVTAPIVASVSDLITLLILIGVGTAMLSICQYRLCVLSLAVIGVLLLIIPFFSHFASEDGLARDVLRCGLWALITAVIIGSASGVILQTAISVYPGIAVFHPLIAGLGGNRVSVQSTRLCTSLHLSPDRLGHLPHGTNIWTYLNPLRLLCLQNVDSKIAAGLIVGQIPYNIIFVSFAFITSKNVTFSWLFMFVYCIAAIIQGIILFYICQVTVYTQWRLKIDPDSSSIPILTSCGDLLGIALLYAAFTAMRKISPGTIRYELYEGMYLNSTRDCGYQL